jgi:integrase
MAKFAKNVNPVAVAKTQAANIMKSLQGNTIQSVGTVRNYEQALSTAAQYANGTLQCGLRDITRQQAEQYLTDRAVEVGQKTLDMDRQALQIMMQNVSGKLANNEKLNVVKSEHSQVLNCRSYTHEQVAMIANSQNERNGLATEIAHAAGLRTHELLTLNRINERALSDRPSRDEKFTGRNNEVSYSVTGKGGLTREVQLPRHLSDRLEERRLETPVTKTDRNVIYKDCRYDLAGGQLFSISFTRASNRTLGWSSGAHGLRHSYAQERMSELQCNMTRDLALEVVSQELGHFRPEITEVYLR